MGTEFTTLAGLFFRTLRVPEPGEVVIVNRWRLEVVDLECECYSAVKKETD